VTAILSDRSLKSLAESPLAGIRVEVGGTSVLNHAVAIPLGVLTAAILARQLGLIACIGLQAAIKGSAAHLP
jgi:hypothetical protein